MSVNWPAIIAIVVYTFIGLVVTCTLEYAYARSHGPQVWDADEIAGTIACIGLWWIVLMVGTIWGLGWLVLQGPKYATTLGARHHTERHAKRNQQRVEQEQRKPIERELDQYLDGKPVGPSNQRFPR